MELVLFKNDSKTYNSLGEFIKIVKTELDKLIDNGPFIPSHIVGVTSECSIGEQIQHYELEKSKHLRSSFDKGISNNETRKKLKDLIIKDDDFFVAL